MNSRQTAQQTHLNPDELQQSNAVKNQILWSCYIQKREPSDLNKTGSHYWSPWLQSGTSPIVFQHHHRSIQRSVWRVQKGKWCLLCLETWGNWHAARLEEAGVDISSSPSDLSFIWMRVSTHLYFNIYGDLYCKTYCQNFCRRNVFQKHLKRIGMWHHQQRIWHFW